MAEVPTIKTTSAVESSITSGVKEIRPARPQVAVSKPAQAARNNITDWIFRAQKLAEGVHRQTGVTLDVATKRK